MRAKTEELSKQLEHYKDVDRRRRKEHYELFEEADMMRSRYDVIVMHYGLVIHR